MHEDFVVVVQTKSGIFGDVGRYEDRKKADQRKEQVEGLVKDHPEERITFNPPGFGFGAPLPLDAVTEVVVLGPGEMVPDSWSDGHIPKAETFHEGLKAHLEARK